MTDPDFGRSLALFVAQQVEPLRAEVAALRDEVARLRAAVGAERRGPTAQLKKLIGISE